jgi:hypothetical protein
MLFVTLLFLQRRYMILGRWWIAQHEFTILEFGAFHNTPAIKKCKWLQSQNKIRPHTTSNIYTLLNVFTKHKQTKKNPWVVHMYVPKVTKNTHLPRITRSQNWTSPCQYAVWTGSSLWPPWLWNNFFALDKCQMATPQGKGCLTLSTTTRAADVDLSTQIMWPKHLKTVPVPLATRFFCLSYFFSWCVGTWKERNPRAMRKKVK